MGILSDGLAAGKAYLKEISLVSSQDPDSIIVAENHIEMVVSEEYAQLVLPHLLQSARLLDSLSGFKNYPMPIC